MNSHRCGCLLTIIATCAIGASGASASSPWRVDRLGFVSPDFTTAGVQRSETREGTHGGQVRLSEDPLAYITGTSTRYWIDGQPTSSTQHWIYDVRRREHIDISAAVDAVLPDSRVSLLRATSDGIAWGGATLVVDGVLRNDVTTGWWYENGNVTFLQPETPPGIMDGRDTYTGASASRPLGQARVGGTFSGAAQSNFVWSYEDGQVRYLGYYDEHHRGHYFNNALGRNVERYSSLITDFIEDDEFGNFLVGRSARYTDFQPAGSTVWIDDGQQTTRLGFYDAAHTAPETGEQLSSILLTSNSLQVIGSSNSYTVGKKGRSLWRYDIKTGETVRIGLFDSAHTDPVTGVQQSSLPSGDRRISGSNADGDVIGYSTWYGDDGAEGQSAWISRGAGGTRIGLIDAEHTGMSDESFNFPLSLNDAGQVVGTARRYDWPGAGDSATSESVWFFDGTNTKRIGFFDEHHTNPLDGHQRSQVDKLTESGHAFGTSDRFDPIDGASRGQSAWIYDGQQTIRVGLTDELHTHPVTGAQSSTVTLVNSVGQAVGWSQALGSQSQGRIRSSTWFYDPVAGHQDLIFSSSPEGDLFGTTVMGLSDEGVLVGHYLSFDHGAPNGIWRPFRWSAGEGLTDITDLILEHHPGLNIWESSLLDAETALLGQFLISTTSHTSPGGGQSTGIFLVTLVPEPSALGLAAIGMVAVGCRRIRRGTTLGVIDNV